MGPTPASRRTRGAGPISWLPALFVTAFMLGILLASSGGPPSPGTSGRWVGRNLWTNGELEASFAYSVPGVTLGLPNHSGAYGMYAGVRAVSEVAPNGSEVATAWFNGSFWNIGNLTSSARVNVAYSANVPVVGGGTPESRAPVTVAFSIPPVTSSSDGFTLIGVTVTVGPWPWVHPSDGLALLFPVWPSNASESHLASTGGSTSVNCLSNDSGTVLEYLAWNSTGESWLGSGGTAALRAHANITFASPRAFVWVRFDPTSPGYAGLEYAATVGVFTPGTTSAPFPLGDVGLLAASGTVIALLAVWTRSVGKRVPSLLR